MAIDWSLLAIPKPEPRPKKARTPIRNRSGRTTKPVTKERRKKVLARIQAERDAKAEVRERDQTCRWPGCSCQRSWGWAQGASWMRQLEVAHLEDKGMGGDKQLIRTQRHKMILLCGWRHRGSFGLHAKRARIEPLTDKGTDGPCEFLIQRQKNGQWELAGIG
jgi:hypothetical protein